MLTPIFLHAQHAGQLHRSRPEPRGTQPRCGELGLIELLAVVRPSARVCSRPPGRRAYDSLVPEALVRFWLL